MSYIDTMSLPFYFLLLLFLCTCNADNPLGNLCNTEKNISTRGQISANIDRLLSELVSKTPSTGFTATSFGTNKSTVYGLAQCRGDVSSKDCSICVQDAAKKIRQLCPNKADARIWYDFCFLRYKKAYFFQEVDTDYGIYEANDQNVTDPEMFYEKLGTLLDRIRAQATDETKNERFGKGEIKLSHSQTLYALVQCTGDLYYASCDQCLGVPIGNFKDVCYKRKGCRVLYSSCTARYELYPFFFPLDSNKTIVNP